MGGSGGGKGFLAEAVPMVFNTTGYFLDKAGVVDLSWDPLTHGMQSYFTGASEGRANTQDFFGPLFLGDGYKERKEAINENQKQWQAYYEDQQLQFKRKMDELRGKMPETAQPKKPIAAPVMPTLLGGDLTEEDITGSLINEQNKR